MTITRLLALGIVGLVMAACIDDGGTAPSTPGGTPPADGSSSSLTATLRLTGTGCDYDGPTELAGDSRVDTQLDNATDVDGGFVLVKVAEESTYGELAEYVRTQAEAIDRGEDSVSPPSDVGVVQVDPPQVPPMEVRARAFTFSEGQYAFVCLEQTSQLPRRDLAIHITDPIVATPRSR